MKHYDFVYLTNTPSFYKLNLCNKIAKTKKVLLVFLGYGSEAVNRILTDKSDYLFDVHFLNEGNLHKRNKFIVFLKLLKLMRSIKCHKVLYSGWMIPEYNLYSFFSRRKRNVVVCESTVWDSSMHGIKGIVKRSIIRRMSAALPSGIPHMELFKAISFKGEVYITGSVGIINKVGEHMIRNKRDKLKCIYVGRLIDVKNVVNLVEEFNINGYELTIAGAGKLEAQLKSIANPNIHFTGFIENEKLCEMYQQHDVFILPSTYEPWGLVVEEALYWGLPVIVSNLVGSSIDLVKLRKTGEVFDVSNIGNLTIALEKIRVNYETYKQAVMQIDWDERENQQIGAYLKLLK